MRDQFSIAFDAYLQILRKVDERIRVVLGRDDQDWRIKNSCPCCCFKVRTRPLSHCHILHIEGLDKLEDEKKLVFSRMFVVDGNNSAKRFMSAALQDDRDFKTDYFLTREQVDIFKDEVKSRYTPAEVDDGEANEVGKEFLVR